MSASLTWKSSKAENQGSSRVRIVVRTLVERGESSPGPLAPEGFAVVRERAAAVRVKPGGVAARRKGYSVSELSTVQAMMMKLRRGEDLRADKIAAAREALAGEDFDHALKVEIAVERILDDMQA